LYLHCQFLYIRMAGEGFGENGLFGNNRPPQPGAANEEN